MLLVPPQPVNPLPSFCDSPLFSYNFLSTQSQSTTARRPYLGRQAYTFYRPPALYSFNPEPNPHVNPTDQHVYNKWLAMAHSCTDDVDEGCASLDAEDYALLGLVVLTDQGDRQCDAANACSRKTPHAEAAADTCTTSSTRINIRASRPGTKRGLPNGYELSKPAKRRGTGFIDLTGVPPQPLILKNQLSATCYQDNSRRRPIGKGSSKYTGAFYKKKMQKWEARIMVQGKARFIGYYDKEEDAAADYARAAFKYKPKKQSLDTYGGCDLSGVPNDLPLIRNERNATGYIGVKPNKGRFTAYIGRTNKTLGTFDTAEEAALIYARAKYYLEQSELSKPKDTPFFDLTGVPPQPLILKNQLSATCYQDNSRRRPIREGSSKYTGVYYDPVDSYFIDSAGDKVDGVAV